MVKVESTSRMPVKIFGTIHTNAFLNSGSRTGWTPEPGQPRAGGRAQRFVQRHLRQTRLGADRRWSDPRTRSSLGRGRGRFLRRDSRLRDRAGHGPAAPPRGVRPDRERSNSGGDRAGPHDHGAERSDVAGLVRVSGAVPIGQPVPARAAGARRAGTPARPPRDGRHLAPVGGDLPGEDYRFVPQAFGGERSRRPAMQGRLAFAAGEPDATRRINIGVSGHSPGSVAARCWRRAPRRRSTSRCAATISALPASCSPATTSTRSAARSAWTRGREAGGPRFRCSRRSADRGRGRGSRRHPRRAR